MVFFEEDDSPWLLLSSFWYTQLTSWGHFCAWLLNLPWTFKALTPNPETENDLIQTLQYAFLCAYLPHYIAHVPYLKGYLLKNKHCYSFFLKGTSISHGEHLAIFPSIKKLILLLRFFMK